jgi:hypothetical protein
MAKGQVRCFKCRDAFQLKDGDWHLINHQEVFLCKRCSQASAQTARATQAAAQASKVAANATK